MLLYLFKIGLDPTPVFVSELECQEVQFWILPLDGSVSNKSRPCSRLFNTDINVQYSIHFPPNIEIWALKTRVLTFFYGSEILSEL